MRFFFLFQITLTNKPGSSLAYSLLLTGVYPPGENTVQLYGSLNSGNRSLQRTTRTLSYWYGFTARYAFRDKKANLTLGVNNPLNRGVKQHSIATAPTFHSESHSLYVTRSVRLTFEWRFGQLNAPGGKQGKKIRNDDGSR